MSMCKATMRAVSEHFGLVLNVQHRFSGPDGVECENMTRLPPDTDVYAAHIIIMRLHGISNGDKVPLQHLASSQLAKHLVDYLETNSSELGLESVGELSLADEGLRFAVTSQYASRNPRTSKPHWRLCGVDLLFSWSNAEDDPFAEHCPLPYMSLLDDVIHRFATFQLARRYPLVFGSWCKQLAIEAPLSASIEKSVRAIIKRSRNQAFQKSARSLLKSLSRNAAQEYSDAALAIGVAPPEKVKSEAFTYAMEKVYKLGQRRRAFKGISRVADDSKEDILHEDGDDEESQVDLGPAHLDDIFAVSGESPVPNSNDLDWDMRGPLENAPTDQSPMPHSDSPLLISPATDSTLFQFADDEHSDGLDDDDRDGYETDASSTLLDDTFATSGELIFSDSDVGDSEYDTAPELESHDRDADRSHTTFSTYSHNGHKPNLEDLFTVGSQQDVEPLSRSPPMLLSQVLSWPTQAGGNDFKSKDCSTPREDILVYTCLESDDSDFDWESSSPPDTAKP